jgi:hypothetical protein
MRNKVMDGVGLRPPTGGTAHPPLGFLRAMTVQIEKNKKGKKKIL